MIIEERFQSYNVVQIQCVMGARGRRFEDPLVTTFEYRNLIGRKPSTWSGFNITKLVSYIPLPIYLGGC